MVRIFLAVLLSAVSLQAAVILPWMYTPSTMVLSPTNLFRAQMTNENGTLVIEWLPNGRVRLSSQGIMAINGQTNAQQYIYDGNDGAGLEITQTYGATGATNIITAHTNSVTSPGMVKEGSGQTNRYWKTDASGNPDWRDEDIRWQDLRVPMQSMRLGAAAPTARVFATNGTIRAYAFDNGTDNIVEWEMQIPHGVETNVLATNGLRFHLHWSATNCVGVVQTNVVWGLEYWIGNVGEIFAAAPTTTLYATNFCNTNWHHIMTVFPWITNAGIRDSAVIVGRLFRDADNGSDTFPNEAYGLSLDAHYPIRRFGSLSEYGD